MVKDYGVLLQSLLGRRYDEAKRESIVSDSFEEYDYGDCVKYALESMMEIDPSYSYKTFSIAKRIQDRITKDLPGRDLQVDFRYSGAVQTETNILLYGGVELIVLAPANEPNPAKRIQTMTMELMDILTKEMLFKEVNNSEKFRIKVVTQKPTCEVIVQPAIWLENPEFLETRREIDRGVCIYNLEQRTRRRYLPFLNIARVNSRDRKTNGGLKNLIRLLKTLQRDSEDPIDLNDYEISSCIYAISDKQITFNHKRALSLLPVASAQLTRLVNDTQYRETLVSPSQKELVFGTKPKVEDIRLLKQHLDSLIEDLNEELSEEKKDISGQIEY